MESNPKISIIVPVYKAEKYIRRCVDSILAQTFTDFEVLLVDDGSPDNSGKICDKYAQTDSRIKVFHKDNGGVSSARQYGLDRACGDYVIHADPDDWVDSEMLTYLYNQAITEESDMVLCDYYEVVNGQLNYVKQEPEELSTISMIKGIVYRTIHGSCWNKLLRRKLITDSGIKFPPNINMSEDKLFIMEFLLKCCKKLSYINKAFYYYSIDNNPNSLTKTLQLNLNQNMYFINFAEKNLLKIPNLRDNFIGQYLYSIVVSSDLSQSEFNKNCKKYSQYINCNVPLKEKIIIKTSFYGLKSCWKMLFKLKQRYKFLNNTNKSSFPLI